MTVVEIKCKVQNKPGFIPIGTVKENVFLAETIHYGRCLFQAGENRWHIVQLNGLEPRFDTVGKNFSIKNPVPAKITKLVIEEA